MSMTATLSFGDRLAASPVYENFRDHPFFAAVDTADFTKEQAAILIEQWWHPLHYFPTFLARCVAVLPDIASKSAITRILNREASERRESALGFIFATETTDLLMVSSIGKAIERTTGVTDNEWVSIHVEQEPDHVEEANHALLADFSVEQESAVLEAANEMWRLWTAFFNRLAVEVGVRTAPAR